MNIIKKIAAGLLALAVAASASATQVQLTGAISIRKATYAAIVRTLAAGGNTVYVVSTDPNFNNKTPDGSQQAVFVSVNGGVIKDSVQVALSGAVGGLAAVVGGSNVQTSITSAGNPNTTWLHVPAVGVITANWPTVTVTAGGAFTYTGGTIAVNGALGNLGQSSSLPAADFDPPATAHIVTSDLYQASTQYDPTDWGLSLTDIQEGTVSQVFAKGAVHPRLPAGSYARLTSLTAQNFQALVNKGFIELQQITGNTADAAVDVVLVGRNSDAGSRWVVFAETGIGPGSVGAAQYIPLDASGNDASNGNPIRSFQLLASNQDGYDSSAFLKQTLVDPINDAGGGANGPGGNPFIEVGYLSAGDTAGTLLSYNGVPLSQSNIVNGTYTLWSTNHFLYDNSGVLSAAQTTLATSIASNLIVSNNGSVYINQGGLNCHRVGAEGSTVLVP